MRALSIRLLGLAIIAGLLLSAQGASADNGRKPPGATTGAKLATWQATYTADGSLNGRVVSEDDVPGRSAIRGLEGRIVGDFSACDDGGTVEVSVPGAGLMTIAIDEEQAGATEFTSRPRVTSDVHIGLDGAAHLSAQGLCLHDDGQGSTGVPMPSYELFFTFEWTDPQPLTPAAFR